MERIKKTTVVFLILMILTGLLTGCGEKTEESDSISFLYLNALDLKCGDLVNQPAVRFATQVREWQMAHPEVLLSLRERSNLSDISALARLGGQHLPDVFMADCQTGRLLAESGLILDLTEVLDDDTDRLGPFTYDDGVYAFPVMMKNYTVLVCDPLRWQEAGYDTFPASWDELLEAADFLSSAGCEPVIGTRKKNGSSSNSDLLSLVLNDEPGKEWFAHMKAKDREAAFTDCFFTDRLDLVIRMMDSRVLCGQNRMEDGVFDAFAEGQCAAALVTGVDVYRLLEKTQEKNPELYNRVIFAALPWLGQEEGTTACVPAGCPYGLFLNANLKDCPEKLAVCLQLCRELELGEQRDLETDATLARLHMFTASTETCPICTQYLNGTVWSSANQNCFNHLGLSSGNTKTAREYVAKIQDSYEEYYLKAEDYSKLVRQFS